MKIFLIAVTSMDGFIADDPSQRSTDWTSKADKKLFKEITQRAGVLVMGRKTFATIGRPLKNRLNVVYTNKTKPELLKEFNLEAGENPDSLLQTTKLSIKELIKELENQGFDQVAVGGGASVFSQFLASGVVDEIYLTIEPVIFGQGINLFDQVFEKKLQLIELKQLNDQGTTLLHYKLDREEDG